MNRLKLKLLIGFFILFLNCEYSYSQIVNITKDYKESINIPQSSDGKINVFVFTKSNSSTFETNRLVNNLNAMEALGLINFDVFNIYSFTIIVNDSAPVCAFKSLILDGIDMASYFIYDPYYIIVETSPLYHKLVSERPGFNSGKSISSVTNKENEKSQFVNFSDDRVFINFIKEKITSANDSNFANQINKLQQQHTLDSTEKVKAIAASRSDRFLGVQYSMPLSYSLIRLDESNIEADLTSSFSLSLDFKRFPVNKKYGAGIEVNFNQTSFNLTSGNTYSDTIPWLMTDSLGKVYKGIIYSDSIEEKVSLTTLSIIPQFSFRWQPFNPKWTIIFSPGIKFSTVLSARYNAVSGNLSYGGLYTQSGSDTVFIDTLSFNDQKQQLAIKSELVSLFLPISIYYHYKSNWYFNLGVKYELGLSNILNNEFKDKMISVNQNNYSSMLYRQEKIKINSFSLRVGVAYLF